MGRFLRYALLSAWLITFVGTTNIFAADTWDAEKELPQWSYTHTASPAERALADQLRAKLIESLKFWQQRGLPNPPNIDSMVFVPSYDNVRVVELLQVFNPQIPNIVEHIKQQYLHFRASDFYKMLTALEMKANAPQGTLSNKFFDNYAGVRYGFSLPRFIETVVMNPFMTQLAADAELVRPSDNAYYARYPEIDLTQVLPLHLDDKKRTALLMNLLSNPDDLALSRLVQGSGVKPRIARRLVILPRTTEQAGSTDVSTLNDASVSRHEVGHHMNATIAEPGLQSGIPRMTDEAMADYLAASMADDPKIGAFFAKAGATIADRLKNSQDPTDLVLAKHLREIAAKGALRDMSDVVTIDEIGRTVTLGDDYSSGHPIRTFLWNMRKNSGVDAKKVDETALRAVKELSNVPMIITDTAMLQLNLRGFMQEMRKLTLTKLALKQLLVETKQEEFTQAEVDAYTFLAKQIVAKHLQQKEQEAKERRMARTKAGERPPRSLVNGDYIIPEFFRAFYRAAQALGYEDVATAVEKAAGPVMASQAVGVKLADGTRELAFFRNPALVGKPEVMAKLVEHFEARKKITKTIIDIPDATPAEELKKVMPDLMKNYGSALNRVIQFERTGFESRLTDPNMHEERLMALHEHIVNTCQKSFRVFGL